MDFCGLAEMRDVPISDLPTWTIYTFIVLFCECQINMHPTADHSSISYLINDCIIIIINVDYIQEALGASASLMSVQLQSRTPSVDPAVKNYFCNAVHLE